MPLALRWISLPIAIIAITAPSSPTDHAVRGAARATVTVGRRNAVTTLTGTERWRTGTRYVLDGPVVADGTMLQPIVMTCKAATKYSGCWDGLVVNGYARINTGAPSSPPPRGGAGEDFCLHTGDDHGMFGGCDSADSSGVLRYVRVEYATDGSSMV